MLPKVSIIVPNYNHAKWLNQRLDSLLNQTYQDFEIIILDDKSTDNSVEVLRSYEGSPKISQVCINEINSGSPFVQWNKGIRLAKGEFIWLAESDDYADTLFLQTHVQTLESDPGIGLSYCQSWLVDESSDIILSCSEWMDKRWKNDFKNVGIQEFREYGLFSHGIVNASAVVFRKSVVEKISSSFLNYKYLGDELFWNEIMWNSNVAYHAAHLNYFRNHTSNTSKKMTLEGIRISEGYQLLSLYNIKFNCKNLPAFKKKFNYTTALWSRDILQNHFSFSINKTIFYKAFKVDKLIILKVLYFILRNLGIRKF